MDRELLLKWVEEQNPWWRGRGCLRPEIDWPRREAYDEVKRRVLADNLVTAVTGLRRVGKTTLLKQLIGDLLETEGDKFRLVYFSFEEYTLAQKPEFLQLLVDSWRERFGQGKIIFVLDEIQYVDYWNALVKRYVDLDRRLKFVVSGSSALFLKTKARESLAGRILETVLPPAGFGEDLRLTGKERGSLTDLEAIDLFHQYLCWGEFPYLSNLTGWKEKREYVENWVLGKVVEIDLPKYQRVIRPAELKDLVRVLLERPGQLVELQNLASDLGLAKNTLRHYLDLLEQCHLMYQMPNCGAGFRNRGSRSRRIYPTAVNLAALKLTSGPDSESFALRAGELVETYVAGYLKRRNPDVYFFRRADKEVDFVDAYPEKKVPIEVKYQGQIRSEDLKSLLGYCKKEGIKRALVVTKNKAGEEVWGGVEVEFVQAYQLA